jgi:hypothetical protein
MDWLLKNYDQNDNGSICVGEFFYLFHDVNDGTVPWPAPTPDEDDVMPTPDEDDVMPTPDEDDMPTPDEDDMPTPDEDDMPTPDEDDMPTPDEDDMPTPDEDDMPTPDEDDEVTPTPDEQDIIDAFEYADMMDDGELEAYELEMVWMAYCESELNVSCWGQDADSECCTRDTAAIIEMFDEDNSGTMCLDEFANFFNQVNDETIVWPEEDEDDDMPTPDEDDMPTPDEDDMPTPDEDDMPTPDEDDEVDPTPTPDTVEEIFALCDVDPSTVGYLDATEIPVCYSTICAHMCATA